MPKMPMDEYVSQMADAFKRKTAHRSKRIIEIKLLIK
jgi:hypothetical protein